MPIGGAGKDGSEGSGGGGIGDEEQEEYSVEWSRVEQSKRGGQGQEDQQLLEAKRVRELRAGG